MKEISIGDIPGVSIGHAQDEKAKTGVSVIYFVNGAQARKMHIVYNREKAKAFPLQLKEWNFYQIQCGSHVLQITLGHVSYICSISATLMDITTGRKWEFSTMKPMYIPKLDVDPEAESTCQFEDKDFSLSFRVTKDARILTVQGKNQTYRKVDIQIILENDPQ